ncbi:MAG: hypothetical protein PUA56_02250 [Bacillales bacterium]|nr:hypothetical protein [Bacillales bacterium]
MEDLRNKIGLENLEKQNDKYFGVIDGYPFTIVEKRVPLLLIVVDKPIDRKTRNFLINKIDLKIKMSINNKGLKISLTKDIEINLLHMIFSTLKKMNIKPIYHCVVCKKRENLSLYLIGDYYFYSHPICMLSHLDEINEVFNSKCKVNNIVLASIGVLLGILGILPTLILYFSSGQIFSISYIFVPICVSLPYLFLRVKITQKKFRFMTIYSAFLINIASIVISCVAVNQKTRSSVTMFDLHRIIIESILINLIFVIIFVIASIYFFRKKPK